jgi:hypothetical protein
MPEHRLVGGYHFTAQAISDSYYGPPRVVVLRDTWNADTVQWESGEVIHRADLPVEDDGELADADVILAEMGWTVVTGEHINDDGWHHAGFGAIATVEPID